VTLETDVDDALDVMRQTVYLTLVQATMPTFGQGNFPTSFPQDHLDDVQLDDERFHLHIVHAGSCISAVARGTEDLVEAFFEERCKFFIRAVVVKTLAFADDERHERSGVIWQARETYELVRLLQLPTTRRNCFDERVVVLEHGCDDPAFSIHDDRVPAGLVVAASWLCDNRVLAGVVADLVGGD